MNWNEVILNEGPLPSVQIIRRIIAFCDAAESWQLGFQDAATPIMQGIIDLHHDIFFFLILILVFVLSMLVQAIISNMDRKRLFGGSSSSSSSSPSNKKDKRREKENFLRNMIVEEFIEYLSKYKKEILDEFPKADSYIETTHFLSRITEDYLEGVGLRPQDTDLKMPFLNSVHQTLIDDFNLVKVEGYKNTSLYPYLRDLLKNWK